VDGGDGRIISGRYYLPLKCILKYAQNGKYKVHFATKKMGAKNQNQPNNNNKKKTRTEQKRYFGDQGLALPSR
jgi:hypothetical protein